MESVEKQPEDNCTKRDGPLLVRLACGRQGMYALLLILVMALTGLTWSFGWYRTAFYTVFGVDTPSRMEHGHAAVNMNIEKSKKGNGRKEGKEYDRKGDALHGNTLSFVYWQQVYEELAKENPGCKQISVSDGSASVSSNFFGNTRERTAIPSTPVPERLAGVSRYAEMDNSSKIRRLVYSVHVGSWGGMLTRILWFLAALLGASLPLTGYYLWIKRICRKKHS